MKRLVRKLIKKEKKKILKKKIPEMKFLLAMITPKNKISSRRQHTRHPITHRIILLNNNNIIPTIIITLTIIINIIKLITLLTDNRLLEEVLSTRLNM